MGLGVQLPNLAGGLMLRKQSDLCREPHAAHELSLLRENKLPKYTALESTAKPSREAETTQKPRDVCVDLLCGGHSLTHRLPGTWHGLLAASFA